MTLRAFRGPRYRTIETHGSLDARGYGGSPAFGGVTVAVIDTWDRMRELERFRSEDLTGTRKPRDVKIAWARSRAAQLAAELTRRHIRALVALDEPADRA